MLLRANIHTQWLTKLFAGHDVDPDVGAREVFLEQDELDVMSMCFAEAVCMEDLSEDRVRRAADLGCAYAQHMMAGSSIDEMEQFRFARDACLQGERNGLLHLAAKFEKMDGYGCENSKTCYLIAAELGDVESMQALAFMFEEQNPMRYVSCCTSGRIPRVMRAFADQVRMFFASDSGQASVVFAIGQAIAGSEWKDEWRGVNYEEVLLALVLNRAVTLTKCESAVKAWIGVGLRIGLKKDTRKMIAKMIWEM